MPRILSGAAAMFAVAALVAAAAPARAQMMTAVILSIGDRDMQSPPTPIATSMNLAECLGSTPVVVRISNVPATATQLDMWYGAGCQDATLRTSTTTTTCSCLNLTTATNGAAMVDITTTVDKLLGVGIAFRGSTVIRDCRTLGLDGDSQFPVTVLAATMNCTTEMVTSYATISNGTDTFTVDTVPPTAPISLTAGSGDTAVPVSWMPPSSGLAPGGSYSVYVDPSASGGGDGGGACVSSLVEGGAAPTTAYRTQIVALTTNVDASALGIAYMGSAGVAAAAVDKALNVSPLSNVACLTRIQSNGFWETYTGGGGTASTCSVSAPGSRGGALAGALGLALVALGIAVRWRGRR